jgi:hypothetical protein
MSTAVSYASPWTRASVWRAPKLYTSTEIRQCSDKTGPTNKKPPVFGLGVLKRTRDYLKSDTRKSTRRLAVELDLTARLPPLLKSTDAFKSTDVIFVVQHRENREAEQGNVIKIKTTLSFL